MSHDDSALRAEVERCRRRSELWRSSAAMLQLAVWQEDLVTGVVDGSDEALALFGVQEDEQPSRDAFLRAAHPDDRHELAAVLRRALEGADEETRTYRHRIVRRDGEVRWLETRVRLERDGEGRPVRLVCASLDRTDRARREEALGAGARPRPLPEVAEAVFVTDAHGRYVDVNDEACELLGYTREELLARTIGDLLDPDEARVDPPVLEAIVAGEPVRRDRRIRRKDGGFSYLELSVERLEDGRLRAFARDVTRRVAAERALRESEATLRELGANLPALLWVREVGTERLLYANDGWTAVLGAAPVVGEHYGQLVLPVHPDDLPRLVVDPPTGELQERDQVVRFVLPDGSIAWYRVCKFGIRDAAGRPNRVAGFALNVTEQRAAEEKVRASLREKETLLREIHHRVKNNLQVVSSLLHLQAASSDAPGLSALLEQSQSRVASMALVHDMLHRSPSLSRIPFAEYVRALGTSVAITYGVSNERVALLVDAGDRALGIDTAVSCGLLLNELLSNAFEHAFPDGARGNIRVALHLDDEPAARAAGHGHRFHLHVSDDGVGLPADFEARRRMSLGTKLVENLVEQLGGTMTRSSSGSGTAYDIVFRADLDDPCASKG